MTSRPEDGENPGQSRSGGGGGYSVDARGASGLQVGEGNFQANYTYNNWLTSTDGVAPPPLASVSGEVDSPYRGLSSFEERDAAFFFGREDAATDLLARLSRLLERRGMLMVSGASGAGKSSLLLAGVLPRLRGAGLAAAPGAASWRCLVFLPGRAPLDELAVRVAPLAGADAAALRRGLDIDPGGFALTARQAALVQPAGPGGEPGGAVAQRLEGKQRLLLVVDQFEQIFTLCEDDRERQAFITALCAAAGAGQDPGGESAALVVLGVRADFEARCADFPELADVVQDRYLVPAMTGRQLGMAITGPARMVGSRVDDDLVEVLLAEVRARQPGGSGVGVLPLLSHALDQAWRSRTGETLTLADYERTGGIEAAVATSAQRAYDKLTAGQQAAARQVFTRLTATSADGVDTADRATMAELTAGKSPAMAADVTVVLEAFAAERLLTLAADSVEISHEVLLTAWPLLRDTWLAETHADRITRTRLRNTAAEWERRARDPSYLYRGTLLAAAEAATKTAAGRERNLPLSQAERDFLLASSRARRRLASLRRAAISGLALLAGTATVIAVVAVHIAGISAQNATNAAQQKAIALSRQLAAESIAVDPTDPLTARQLAVAAWSVSHTDQAGSALVALLTEQQQDGMLPGDISGWGVSGIAFSPDGTSLAIGYADGDIRLWNTATGQIMGKQISAETGRFAAIDGLAFSPDGKLLASAGMESGIRLWNPTTGQSVGKPFATNPSAYPVNAVAFSPDGKLLASANSNGIVQLWNPATGRPVHAPIRADTGPYGGVNAVAFSPDGKLLASADADGNVRLWNPATGRPIGARLPADIATWGINDDVVAFSPDGKLLASANSNGTVQLWNPATGRPARAPIRADTGPDGGVSSVAFSPDGKLLASADADGNVRFWNPATGRPARAPIAADTGSNGYLGAVAFSPDGKLLASADSGGGSRGTVRLWELATGRPVHAPIPAAPSSDGSVGAVAYSPDGKLLAVDGSDPYIRLWNPATGQAVGAPIAAGVDPFSGAALVFSPDGKMLASADADGDIRLWNPATGRPVRAISGLQADLGGGNQMAFSPDGKLLAGVGADGDVRLWSLATGRTVGAPIRAFIFSKDDSVTSLAYSPNGKLLATGDIDGNVGLWDTATGHLLGTRIRAAMSTSDEINAVVFSPDGKLLATAGSGGYVRLWNPATGKPVGLPIPADTTDVGGVNSVVFSPDGKLLATADSGGYVRLWNPATGKPVGLPIPADTTDAGGVNSVVFSPNGKLLASTGADGYVQQWQVPLFVDPYQTLCADAGPPTAAAWAQYAGGEPQPSVCA